MAFERVLVWFAVLCVITSVQLVKVEAGDICSGYPVNETIGGNFTKTDLHNHLFKCSGYVRDIWDHEPNDALVTVITGIRKLIDVNSAMGELTLKIGILMTWHDRRLKWNTTWYSGATVINKDLEEVWVPPVALSLAQYTRFERLRVEIQHTGTHWFFLAFKLNVPCDFTLRLFPFDRQSCWINFTDHTVLEHQVQYQCADVTHSENNMYSHNSEWNLEKTDCGEKVKSGRVILKIYLSRKSEFYVLNVLIPVMSLSVMNASVFLLPVEFVGRVGLCVSVFLAWTVYITFVISIVPNGSDGIPWLSYVLVVQSIISLVSLLVNVLLIRLNFVENDWLMGYFQCSCRPCQGRCLSCRPIRCPRKNRVHGKKLKFDDDGTEAETEITTEGGSGDYTATDNVTCISKFVTPIGCQDNKDPEGCTVILFKKRINNGCLVVCFLVTIALYASYFAAVFVN